MVKSQTKIGTRILTLVITLLSLLLLLKVYSFYSIQKNQEKQSKQIEQTIEKAINNTDVVKMSSVMNLEWDRLYIFTPYTSLETINKQLGFNWLDTSLKIGSINPFRHRKTHIDYLDDRNLIVFTKNNSVIAYLDFPRIIGNFKINKTNIFYPNNAIFEIKKNNNGLTELIPKENIFQRTKTDLGRGYFKDKDTVYFHNDEIANADINTFKVLSENYSKDKNHVYRWNKEIKDADVETFEVINNDQVFAYAKDKNYGYYLGEKIEGSDGLSFQYLNYALVKDKNFVYLINKKIIEADPQSFHLLEGKYAQDKNNVYYYSFVDFESSMDMFYKIIEEADLISFKYLKCNYAKDNNYIYFQNEIVKKADLRTFRVLDKQDCEHNFYAKDKNNTYKNGVIVDPNSI